MGHTRTRRHGRSRIAAKLTTLLVISAGLAAVAPATSSASVLDLDNDGLGNLEELVYQTRPLVADTDGDGLKDGAEVKTYKTKPTVKDTDNDGVTDGAEVNTYKSNPLKADTDGDGLTDGQEVDFSDPTKIDTDGDGFTDRQEFAVVPHSDPRSPTSRPLVTLNSVTTSGTTVRYTFSSTDSTATFTCLFGTAAGLNGAVLSPDQPCTSPATYDLAAFGLGTQAVPVAYITITATTSGGARAQVTNFGTASVG